MFLVDARYYKIVANEVCVAYEEKGSKFLGYTKYIKTEDQIAEFLKLVRQAHPQATHICYAYVMGANGEISKNNDAGEPAGTAGLPILDSIKKVGLTNTLVVVVRYFGGKELGRSGLYKAYSKTASEALSHGGLYLMIECAMYEFRFSYNDFSKVGAYFRDMGFPILKQEYGQLVRVEAAFPAHKEQVVFSNLKTLLGGTFMNNKIRNAYFKFESGYKI